MPRSFATEPTVHVHEITDGKLAGSHWVAVSFPEHPQGWRGAATARATEQQARVWADEQIAAAR